MTSRPVLVLRPSGFPQMLDEMEPGLFVMVDKHGIPTDTVGIKTEYGPEFRSYNEAGEMCGNGLVIPAETKFEWREGYD